MTGISRPLALLKEYCAPRILSPYRSSCTRQDKICDFHQCCDVASPSPVALVAGKTANNPALARHERSFLFEYLRFDLPHTGVSRACASWDMYRTQWTFQVLRVPKGQMRWAGKKYSPDVVVSVSIRIACAVIYTGIHLTRVQVVCLVLAQYLKGKCALSSLPRDPSASLQ